MSNEGKSEELGNLEATEVLKEAETCNFSKSKGVLRFFFEYGAGGCLWSGNAETTNELGYGPVDAACYSMDGEVFVEPSLPLSDAAIKLRDKLDFEHSGYLNPKYPPDPSLWSQTLCERFNNDVDALIKLIRVELGDDYEILDKQKRYSEDPELEVYLAENPDLARMDQVLKPTVSQDHR